MDIWYADGKFVPEDEAFVSARDLAVLRGFGVFDFLRTYHRKPFYLEAHIDRFFRSADVIGLKIPMSKKETASVIEETLSRNPHLEEANIRFVFTGGSSPDNTLPADNAGKFYVMVSRKQECPASWYSDGVKTITVDQKRAFPEAKSIDYIAAIQAQRQAKSVGAVEALYTDEKKRVLEATTCNFFIVKNGKLVTPGDGILRGITRMALLELLDGKIDVEIRDISLNEALDADEAFITASNKEIVPVVRINDSVIGDGKVGKTVKQVTAWFREMTDRY